MDEDKNHLCDVCQEKISDCVDKNGDKICDECNKKMLTVSIGLENFETDQNLFVSPDYSNGDESVCVRVEKWGVTIDTFTNNLLNTNIIVAPGTHDAIDIESSISGTPEVAVTVITDAKVVLSGWTVNNEFYCPIVFKIGASSDTFVEIESLDYESEDVLIQAIESEIEKATIKYYDAGTKIPNNTKIPLYFSWEWKFEEGNDMSDTALGNNSPQPNISISITQSIEQAQTFN